MSNENPDVSNGPTETVVSMRPDGTLHFTLPADAFPRFYLGLTRDEDDRLLTELARLKRGDDFEEFLLRLSILKTAAARWEAWRAGEVGLTGFDAAVTAGFEVTFGLRFDRDKAYLRPVDGDDEDGTE